MSKPTITIYDVATGEVVERPMNAEEIEQYKIDQAATKAKLEKENAALEAKAALFAKLGITAEEAALLLG
jgi:hypothetical protein